MTTPISTTLLTGVPEKTPAKMVEAAKQFEALLIGQMLRSVREAGADDDEDNASATMYDVADQQFSQLLANHGGLGLSRMIASGLEQESTNENRQPFPEPDRGDRAIAAQRFEQDELRPSSEQ